MNNLKNLRGTVDLLPDQLIKWQNVEKIILEQLSRASIKEIRTPVLEMTELFIRGIGEEETKTRKKPIDSHGKHAATMVLEWPLFISYSSMRTCLSLNV